MRSVNIHQAKTQLSKIVDAALHGKETIIAKAGVPIAKVVPLHPKKPVRKFGLLKGKVKIADDFDAPLPEDLQAAFEGRGDESAS